MAKSKAAYPALEKFIDGVIERSGKTASQIFPERPATATAIRRGKPGWENLDKFAKRVKFRDALLMFQSGGDQETAELLGLWERLPSPEARKELLQLAGRVLVEHSGRGATSGEE